MCVKRAPLAVLLGGLLLGFLVSGCGGTAPTPTSTPTPTPTLSPQQMLESAAARMGSLTTVGFTLTHKEGITPVLPGIAAREIEGGSPHLTGPNWRWTLWPPLSEWPCRFRMVVVGPDLPPIVVPQVMRHW